MPTGYTAAVADGIDFKTFAMNCARAFGALVTMRDDPADAEIPDAFPPSDYHERSLAEARTRLAALNAMTPDEIAAAAETAWQNDETYRARRIAECRALRAKYEALLADVVAWAPPTPDHIGMHEFMQQQLRDSLKHDCDESFYAAPEAKPTPAEWLTMRRERAEWDIKYHTEHHAQEVARAKERTDWVRMLRASLK